MAFVTVVCAAMLLQTALVYHQYLSVQRQVGRVKKEFPIVSVGSTRGALNRSAVLAFDRDGVLRRAFVLAGFTVFTRLSEVESYNGQHYGQIKRQCADNGKMRCFVDAIAYVEKHFEKISKKEVAHD